LETWAEWIVEDELDRVAGGQAASSFCRKATNARERCPSSTLAWIAPEPPSQRDDWPEKTEDWPEETLRRAQTHLSRFLEG
jgi:hypothetical protein